MDAPPPPYSAIGPSPSQPQNPVVARNPLMQLRRYLIEIMGFTFNADFSLLNQALGQTASTTNSILTPHERAELLNLVTLIQELRAAGPNVSTAWLTVHSSDREAVADAFIRPALYLGLPASYILEVVSTYASHQCDESKRSLSLISQKKPYCYELLRSLFFLGPFNIPMTLFTLEIWSHGRVIDIAAPNEEVRIVLGGAMQVYQKEVLGIEKVPPVPRVLEDYQWKDLKSALISRDEELEIKSRRSCKEQKRVEKKVAGYGRKWHT